MKRFLLAAVERGLNYIESLRTSAGSWEDFGIAGPSDMWTSAYVGALVAEIGTRRARRMAATALEWLLDVNPPGRWGYSSAAPCDADTTTWVARLAINLKMPLPSSTYEFLANHTSLPLGVATFRNGDFIAKFGRDSVDRGGWYAGHGCVTAAAAALCDHPLHAGILASLHGRQHRSGSWDGYWWLDREYTTGLALEGLVKTPGYRSAVDSGVQWLRRRCSSGKVIVTPFLPNGSPFATGAAIRGLAIAREIDDVTDRVARDLIAMQKRDGSWRRSAALRLPLPNVMEPIDDWWTSPEGQPTIWNTPLWDQQCLHTTATAISGLWHYSTCI